MPLFGKRVVAEVAWDGLVIPQDSLLMPAYGQHDGLDNQAVMTDSTASFGTDTFNTGFTIRNLSKLTASAYETATITDTTNTTITGVLSNGADWDEYNYYEIIVAGLETGDKIHYEKGTNQGGTVSINVKGVVTIVGASGTHTFNYWLEDITDSSLSAVSTYTATIT